MIVAREPGEGDWVLLGQRLLRVACEPGRYTRDCVFVDTLPGEAQPPESNQRVVPHS